MVYGRLSTKSSKQLRQRQQQVAPPLDAPQFDLEQIDSHWPPVEDFSNETPVQREERLEREREAKRINDEIDAQIEIEKSERRKRQPDVRAILLGPFNLSVSPNRQALTSLLPFPFFFFVDQAKLNQASRRSCVTFSSNTRPPRSMPSPRRGAPSSTSTSCVPSPSSSPSLRKATAAAAPPEAQVTLRWARRPLWGRSSSSRYRTCPTTCAACA